MALASRLDKLNNTVFVLMGDGEVQEGQVWEAAMFAAHYKLDNLIAFIDHNGLQIDGNICDVLSPEPLPEKWLSFNWHVQVIDGHDHNEITRAIANARSEKGRPSMIIANTVKGKGVSFMENQAGWHGNAPKEEQCSQALAELV